MPDPSPDKSFWSDVLRRVTRRTGGRADSEDLLHSAFLRLEKYRHDHVVEDPAAFLVQTAANLAIDAYRHDRHIVADGDQEILSGIGDPSPLQDEVVEARARLRRVSDGLARLSPRTRSVFLMHRIEGMKYREIATALNISQSAVEKHIAKAALFLVEWMEGW